MAGIKIIIMGVSTTKINYALFYKYVTCIIIIVKNVLFLSSIIEIRVSSFKMMGIRT